jgi:hypothetical protein
MCEQLSWIELSDGHLLYLTTYDLFDTPQGEHVRKQLTEDDWCGHSAIKIFYAQTPQIKLGIDRECTDFTYPSNFPAELADAIKAGKFSWFDPKDEIGRAHV